MSLRRTQSGVTLVEVLVASAVVVVIALSLYQVVSALFSTISFIRTRTVLAEIASQKMEFIRNLTYDNVGTTGGIPSGVISSVESFEQNAKVFTVRTTIRNIDNPEDGTIGGIPNDLSPADNKLVNIEVVCESCLRQDVVTYTSIVAPKYLETENGNGALIIKVVDASGQPIQNATVRVVNTGTVPIIDGTDMTDVHGILAIVDAPPSTQLYQIIVTKDGYSTEQTYLYGAVANPNPTKPHLTVSANTVTQDTFSIDRLAELSFTASSPACTPVEGVPVTVSGTKIIGNPNILKKLQTYTTGTNGTFIDAALEWDTYDIAIGNPYSIVGITQVSPFVVIPGGELEVSAVVDTPNAERTSIGIFDASSGASISDVEVRLTKGGIVDTYTTGRNYVIHTDWSTAISSDIGLLVTSEGVGLQSTEGVYGTTGEFISQSIDMGEGSTARSFEVDLETPSGTAIRFQVASSTDNQTWNFVGPDGTDASYYDVPISLTTSGRYLRYKAFFATSDTSRTPLLHKVTIGFENACTPVSSLSIIGAESGAYTVRAEKNGFETTTKPITIPSTNYETISLTAL